MRTPNLRETPQGPADCRFEDRQHGPAFPAIEA